MLGTNENSINCTNVNMQRTILITILLIGSTAIASAGELTKIRLTAPVDSMLTAKCIYIDDERGDRRDYSVVSMGDSVAYETISSELHREFTQSGDTLRLQRQEWATTSVVFDVAPVVEPLPIGVTQHISARVRHYVHDHYMLEGDLTAERVGGNTWCSWVVRVIRLLSIDVTDNGYGRLTATVIRAANKNFAVWIFLRTFAIVLS